MASRKYNQNFTLASSSRLVEILFISKLNDHAVVKTKETRRNQEAGPVEILP
jgi:hypothetical protein